MDKTIYQRFVYLLLGFGLTWFWPVTDLFAQAQQAPKEAPAPSRETPAPPREPSYREVEIQRTDISRPERDPLKGKLSLSAEWFLDITRGSFSPSWQSKSAGSDFVSLTMPLKVNYKITKDFHATVRVPLEVNWAGNVNRSLSGPNGETSSSFGGVGDVGLIFKYNLLKETDVIPMITGYFSVDFPTGHSRHLNPGRLDTDQIGDGSYNFIYGFNFFKEIKNWNFFGNLWYSMATSSVRDLEGPRTITLHFRDQLIINLAAEYLLTDKWGVLLMFYSLWDTGRIFGPRSNLPPAALLGILPEIDYEFSRNWNFSLGVAIDLAGKNTTYAYTPTFYMKYKF